MIKLFFICFMIFFCMNVEAKDIESNGIAMQGEPRYGFDFKRFEYVNENSIKGGELKMASFGSYDTFNPFTVRGISAAGVNYIFDTLLESSKEEAFTEYALVAKKVILPKDRGFVEFEIDERARFHDGKQVTVQDIIFSFEVIKKDGSPIYNSYYKDVESVKDMGKGRVRFTFKKGADNRELPLIIGQLSILPKHFYENKDFKATTLEPPLGSGPYKINKFEAGRFIEYERVKDYWAKDLPVNKGRYNFDVLRYDYYRDTTVALEALKSGAYDLRVENEAKKWSTAYEEEKEGFLSKIFGKKDDKPKLIKGVFPHKNPSGMQAFVYNMRKDIFKDKELRKALSYAFDFEWTNKNLFYGSYKRTRSFFDNSELSATGLPEGKELLLLNKHKDKLPLEIFNEVYTPSSTMGNGNIRENLEIAQKILKDAGYKVKGDGFLYDKNGKKIEFELLLDSVSSATWERVTLPFKSNLRKLGVDVKIRSVDINQFKNRLDKFDYDMIVYVWGQSMSPGNEQHYFWSSESASQEGSMNYAGISDETIDVLIENVVKSETREDLISSVKALDRVLIWNYFVIPQWHLPETRIVYKDKFSIPSTPPRGVDIMSWSIKGQK